MFSCFRSSVCFPLSVPCAQNGCSETIPAGHCTCKLKPTPHNGEVCVPSCLSGARVCRCGGWTCCTGCCAIPSCLSAGMCCLLCCCYRCVSIYRLISMHNGSDSNTSAHPPETRTWPANCGGSGHRVATGTESHCEFILFAAHHGLYERSRSLKNEEYLLLCCYRCLNAVSLLYVRAAQISVSIRITTPGARALYDDSKLQVRFLTLPISQPDVSATSSNGFDSSNGVGVA